MTGVGEIGKLLRGRRTGAATTDVVLAACVALSMVLLVLIAAANLGLVRRDARAAWRYTPGTDGTGAALLYTVTDHAGGSDIIRVAYGPLSPDAPVPPGLSRQVAPSEVFVSPGLAALARSRPAAYGRYAAATGVIGRAGLTRPDELLAIEGAAPDDERFQPANGGSFAQSTYGPVHVDRFAGGGSGDGTYRSLLAVASTMIVVPALAMVSGAARASTSRRSRELAVGRLVGASTSQLAALAALDVAPAALGGAAGGALASVPLLALASYAPVQGGRWFARDLLLPRPVLAALALGLMGLAAGSAVLAARRSIQDPLAAAVDHNRSQRWLWRAASLPAAVALVFVTSRSRSAPGASAVAVWAVVAAAIGLVGPVVVRLAGLVRLGLTRRGVGLLAARRLLDDPAAAYRRIGPLALAAFLAGLLAALSAGWDSSAGLAPSDSGALFVTFPAGTSASHIDAALDRAGPAVVDSFRVPVEGSGAVLVTLYLDRPADAEQVRARLTGFDPSLLPATEQELDAADRLILTDVSRAALLLLAVLSLASAVGSAALGIGSLEEQRRPLTALRTIGVPLAGLRAARRRALIGPLAASTMGAGATGVALASLATRTSPAWSALGAVTLFVAAALVLALATEHGLGVLLSQVTDERRVLES